MLERLRERIADKAEHVAAAPILMVALGDSVTMGCMEYGEFDYAHVYHHRLKRLLEARYPMAVFNLLNAGVNGQSASGGLARLERDVLRYAPDLVLVAFGLNDSSLGRLGVPRFADTLVRIVGDIRSRTDADVILLTPNFMNTRDGDRVPEVYRSCVEDFIRRQTGGVLAAYAEAVRQVGRANGVAVADVYAAWEDLARRGVDTTGLLSNGLNHPSVEAHRIPAELVMRLIVPEFKVTVLEDLAKA